MSSAPHAQPAAIEIVPTPIAAHVPLRVRECERRAAPAIAAAITMPAQDLAANGAGSAVDTPKYTSAPLGRHIFAL